MRSCASRGARSPGSARNSSSCSRSERVRWRADMRLTFSGAPGRRVRDVGGVWRLAGSTVPTPGSEVDALAPRIDPGLQVLDAIDDAAAELRIARPGAVDAVLLERADGEADEAGGLGRAQIARRQAGEIGGHGKPP